jgi:tripartite-type tricarboxylate transporter receptor subunit TctC
LASLGSEPGGSTPAQFAAYVKEDYARWARVVQAVGLKAE